MRARITLFSVLCLLAAACGGEGGLSIDPDAGFTQGNQGELISLAYGFQPDTRLEYAFDMGMDMAVGMDFPGMDAFDGMEMSMAFNGSMGYLVEPGPDAGTVALTFDMAIDEITGGDLSIDGVPMFDAGELGELDEFTGIIPEVTMVLDAKGEVLEMRYGDVALPTEMLGSMGGGFQDPTGVSVQGMLLGPELPDEEVRVGAEWVTVHSEDVPFIGTVASVSRHRIVSEEELAGRSVLVIETVTEADEVEMNLADLLGSMATLDPAALGMTETELAQLEYEMGMMGGMEMSMSIDYGTATERTWFDPAAGLVVRSESTIPMTMAIEFDDPDGSGSMDMDATIDLTMILADDGVRT